MAEAPAVEGGGAGVDDQLDLTFLEGAVHQEPPPGGGYLDGQRGDGVHRLWRGAQVGHAALRGPHAARTLRPATRHRRQGVVAAEHLEVVPLGALVDQHRLDQRGRRIADQGDRAAVRRRFVGGVPHATDAGAEHDLRLGDDRVGPGVGVELDVGEDPTEVVGGVLQGCGDAGAVEFDDKPAGERRQVRRRAELERESGATAGGVEGFSGELGPLQGLGAVGVGLPFMC